MLVSFLFLKKMTVFIKSLQFFFEVSRWFMNQFYFSLNLLQTRN